MTKKEFNAIIDQIKQTHIMPGLVFPTGTFPPTFYRKLAGRGRIMRYKKRNILAYRGIAFPLARVIYSLGHPHITLGPSDDIHHLDGDHNNDCLTNLTCITRTKHRKLHQKE